MGRGNPRGTAFRYPSLLSGVEQAAHLGIVSRLLARHRIDPPPREEEHPADWLSGGALLVRREVFDEAGLFDEGFFLYFEEVDLTRRAEAAGWPSWFVPGARLVHDAGAATGATGDAALERRVPEYWFASRRRYFLRYHGFLGTLAIDLAWLAGSTLHQLRRLLGSARKDPPHFFFDFLRYNLLGQRGFLGDSPCSEIPASSSSPGTKASA